MIAFGFADASLEQLPYSWGAYFEIVGTDEDAIHKYELREQCYAQMRGWA